MWVFGKQSLNGGVRDMAGERTVTTRKGLTAALDAFAIELLDQAKTAESLADKIAAFEKIGRWIVIKNRLKDKDDETGSSLAALKAKLRGRPIHLTQEHQGMAALRRWGKSDVLSDGDNGGPALEALKAKLPGFKAS
jgi:hypothetical protein